MISFTIPNRKGFMHYSLVGILVVYLISACSSVVDDIKPEDDGTPSTTVVKLNKNADGLRDLANACIQ